MTLKDKVTSVVTGDAYDKPAKTKDGAMTTQDSADAHTLEGTSADPNPPEPGKSTLEKVGDKAEDLGNKAEDKKNQAQDKANNTEAGQKAQEQTNTNVGEISKGASRE